MKKQNSFFLFFLGTIFLLGFFHRCQSPSRTIEADSLLQNELWKSDTNLQLVFTQPIKHNMPVSLARQAACSALTNKREKNIDSFLQKKFSSAFKQKPENKKQYHILQNIISVDRNGNCRDTVLIKLHGIKKP